VEIGPFDYFETVLNSLFALCMKNYVMTILRLLRNHCERVLLYGIALWLKPCTGDKCALNKRLRLGCNQWRKQFWLAYKADFYFKFHYLWFLAECGIFRHRVSDNMHEPLPIREGRMLIWMPAHIGDLILAQPVINRILEAIPSATIDLLVSDLNKNLATYLFPTRNIYTLTPPLYIFRRRFGGFFMGEKDKQLLQSLSKRKYNTVIATMCGPFGVVLREWLHPRYWVGPDPELVGYGNGIMMIKPKERHREQAEYIRLKSYLECLGIKEAYQTSRPIKVTEALMQSVASKFGTQVDFTSQIIAIAPGASWPGKMWPTAKYKELCCQLQSCFGGCIVLLGSPEEVTVCQKVRNESDRIINLAGQLTLPECLAALKQVALFIGNDSGLMHMAAGVGTPTISLWGATNHKEWGSEKRGGIHIKIISLKSMVCAEPWKRSEYLESGGNCMDAISVLEVLAAATRLLA